MIADDEIILREVTGIISENAWDDAQAAAEFEEKGWTNGYVSIIPHISAASSDS